MRLVLVLGLFVSGFAAACAESSSTALSEPLPVGLRMLGALDRLAEDRANQLEPFMISTYDRSGGNLDFHLPPQVVLEDDEEGRTILFDSDGPGVVTRIWLTHFSVREAGNADADSLVEIPGDILFFFDGEDTPRVEMTLQDFFSGERSPFLSPFVLDADHSSGAYVSSLPVAFKEHLRIVSTESIPYLQVNAYRLLEGETESLSLDDVDTESLQAQVESWIRADPPLSAEGARTEQQTLTAAPGMAARVTVRGGPATMSRLTFRLDRALGVNPSLGLQINVDGGPPEVDVPFADFFLTSLYPVESIGRVIGYDGNAYYVTFPMPYDEEIEVGIITGEGAEPVAFEVELETVPGHPAGDLRFHAAFSESNMTPEDGDHPVVEVQGRGHLVGSSMVLCCIEDCSFLGPRFAHLEGDERVYIDGADFPQLHGTGAEDYFNSGFYYAGGTYHQPTHGMTFETSSGLPEDPYGNGAFDCTQQYRLQLTDAVPFRESLRFDLERGPTSNLHTYFRSIAYWYQSLTR